MLSNWEIYVVALMKSTIEGGSAFENIGNFFRISSEEFHMFQQLTDDEQGECALNLSRLDFSRVNLVVLARLVDYLYKRRTIEDSRKVDLPFLVFEEYLLKPMIPDQENTERKLGRSMALTID